MKKRTEENGMADEVEVEGKLEDKLEDKLEGKGRTGGCLRCAARDERARSAALIGKDSSGVGMAPWDVAGELLRLLPQGFLKAYETLALRALNFPGSSAGSDSSEVGVASAKRVVRLSSGQVETRGGAKAGHKRPGLSTRAVVKDERLLALKGKMDRKLRALAREMELMLRDEARGSGVRSVRRCTRCRTYAEGDWSFCPKDGAPTEEIDS